MAGKTKWKWNQRKQGGGLKTDNKISEVQMYHLSSQISWCCVSFKCIDVLNISVLTVHLETVHFYFITCFQRCVLSELPHLPKDFALVIILLIYYTAVSPFTSSFLFLYEMQPVFPWFHAPFQLLLKVQILLLLPHLPFSPQSVVSVPTLPDETAVSKKVTSVLLMHYSRLSSPTPWKLHKYLLINKILF